MWPFTEKVYIKKYSDNEYAVCSRKPGEVFEETYLCEEFFGWRAWKHRVHFLLPTFGDALNRYSLYLEYKNKDKKPKGKVVYP